MELMTTSNTTTNEVAELKKLLREAYNRVPEHRKGETKIVEYDSAGNTYEFTEYGWSKRVREIFDIVWEPTGI